MGNILNNSKNGNSYNSQYEHLINNNENLMDILNNNIRENNAFKYNIEFQIKQLTSEIQNINVKCEKMEKVIENLEYNNKMNNDRINIITGDMENLLNNDKLLLDKLIEKNLVSTVQE
jgi:hypothetical protein